jgi:preprotein translocase SecE subunit
VARNRKRRTDRRPVRPASGGLTPPGVATAASGRRDADPAHDVDPLGAPSPIEHATPDVELAEAQLALGRPELASVGADDAIEGEYEDELRSTGGGGSGRGRRPRGSGGSGGDADGNGDLAPRPSEAPARRENLAARAVHFAQGSWRELQRVQWPDRRQVMQATSVVIGFVIVAGVFLGVSDFVATRLVNLVIK